MAFIKASDNSPRASEFWHPAIGAILEGKLLRYIPPTKPKSYGFYTVQTEDTVIGVNDSYALYTVFRGAEGADLKAPLLPSMKGRIIRLTYQGTAPTKSGSTVKVIDVEVDDGEAPF